MVESRMLVRSVGHAQPNYLEDVTLIQKLLNQHSSAIGMTLVVDGCCGMQTVSAIRAFQRKALSIRLPDGVVSSVGVTFAMLQTSSVRPLLSSSALPAVSPVPPSVLTEADYKLAAATLGCDVSAIKAVAAVEAPRGPFDSQGRPSILYERHIFSRLTRHIYDKTHSDISARKGYGSGGYGSYASQYGKLDVAYKLDPDAAYEAASWGAFQILGENYKQAGFSDIGAFVSAMRRSVADHLRAFVNFIKNGSGLMEAIQKKDWAVFASKYNGPSYKTFNYDVKLAAAYAQNSK